jgi:uncharacterized damage-inducible protein DinB
MIGCAWDPPAILVHDVAGLFPPVNRRACATETKIDMPDELRSLRGDLERVHAGDPWHGSSRAAILKGVTAVQAAKRPGPGAHSIWELVLHMEAWTREVARRLGGAMAAEPEMGDWPEVRDTSDASWIAAQRSLDAAHREILSALDALPGDRLHSRVGDARDPALGSGVSYAAMLRGLAQHDAYHSGQIAMVRKVLG